MPLSRRPRDGDRKSSVSVNWGGVRRNGSSESWFMVDRLERRRFLGGGPLYNPQPKVPTSFTKPTVHFPFLSLGNFVFCFVLLVVDLGIFATHPDSPAPFSLRNYSLARRPMYAFCFSFHLYHFSPFFF